MQHDDTPHLHVGTLSLDGGMKGSTNRFHLNNPHIFLKFYRYYGVPVEISAADL
jgi:hypothetical protein